MGKECAKRAVQQGLARFLDGSDATGESLIDVLCAFLVSENPQGHPKAGYPVSPINESIDRGVIARLPHVIQAKTDYQRNFSEDPRIREQRRDWVKEIFYKLTGNLEELPDGQ